MNCPICNVTLLLAEKQGVEIDYCPKCRGIWLDRGELEKIIEKSTQAETRREDEHQSDNDRHYNENDRNAHDHRYRRKKGFLGDLFDF
jgi:uncharacterized protein